jgi:hypothetical protein
MVPNHGQKEASMSFTPFIFDRSTTAKLIKSIDARDRPVESLAQLEQVVLHDIQTLPYGYLEQACRRAEAALPRAKTDEERDLLRTIHMSALRRIQRIHTENRP